MTRLEALGAIVYRSDVEDGGSWLVFAHGAGAPQKHPFMVAVARGLAARGLPVVTFDFPYMRHGRKAPDRAPVLEAAFREVMSAARETFTPRRLFIGGKSMGGRMATHLAAEGDDVNGVVALGYPLHPPGRPEQPRSAHLPNIRVPVLIVQGERDAFGTPGELKPVLETMTAPVGLHIVPGADHSLAVKGKRTGELLEGVIDAVADWVRRQP